jgi:hypothetical protein
MDLFTRSHLRTLTQIDDAPCVSIYMPAHRTGPETRQDPIRFKNQLQQATRLLEQRDVRGTALRNLLGPAEKWLKDTHFWQHQGDGLAVFLTPQTQWRFRLPREFDEQVRVNNHFHVNPLLPLLQADGTFYVLAVSQNSCRLLSGTRDAVQELQEADLPADLRSAIGWWRESQLNLHSMEARPQTRGGDETAMYHGHEQETHEADLAAYFRKIDAGVTAALEGERAPLVFAGVEYLFPIYRQVNRYPGLCEQAVGGSPDEASAAQLHRRAWEVVEPIFRRREEAALESFSQYKAQQRGTDDVATVFAAARSGLVETLMIPLREELPGRYDEPTGEVELTTEGDTEDLYDRAVLMTLQSSGEVLAVDADRLPEQSRILALLRAPLSTVASSSA